MSNNEGELSYEDRIKELTALKLEKEIKNLNQRFWEKSTFWLSVSLAILAIVGFIVAWQGDLFENRSRLLEIRKDKLEFEVSRLEERKIPLYQQLGTEQIQFKIGNTCFLKLKSALDHIRDSFHTLKEQEIKEYLDQFEDPQDIYESMGFMNRSELRYIQVQNYSAMIETIEAVRNQFESAQSAGRDAAEKYIAAAINSDHSFDRDFVDKTVKESDKCSNVYESVFSSTDTRVLMKRFPFRRDNVNPGFSGWRTEY